MLLTQPTVRIRVFKDDRVADFDVDNGGRKAAGLSVSRRSGLAKREVDVDNVLRPADASAMLELGPRPFGVHCANKTAKAIAPNASDLMSLALHRVFAENGRQRAARSLR
jgi:hypothetical protein